MNSYESYNIGGTAQFKDWFTGMIDEVKLYNRGLTEAEVLKSMEGPGEFSVKPDGKLAVKWGEIKSNN